MTFNQNKVRSRFTINAYFLPFSFVLFGVAPFVLDFLMSNEPKNGSVFFLLICILSWTTSVFCVWEFINHLIHIELTEREIIIRKYIGLGSKTRFPWDELDGFEITVRTSRSEKYEVLHVKKGKKIVIRISQFYIENYVEIKRAVMNKRSEIGEKA